MAKSQQKIASKTVNKKSQVNTRSSGVSQSSKTSKTARPALGRGLSALLAPQAVSVRVVDLPELANSADLANGNLGNEHFINDAQSGKVKESSAPHLVVHTSAMPDCSRSNNSVSDNFMASVADAQLSFETEASKKVVSREHEVLTLHESPAKQDDCSVAGGIDETKMDEENFTSTVVHTVSQKEQSPTAPVLRVVNVADSAVDLLQGRLESNSEPLLIEVSVDLIFPNKDQPRKYFEEEELNSLSNSIRQTGLLQPLIVRREVVNAKSSGRFELVAGERRWRAAVRAGLRIVPCLVRDLDDREVLEIGIVENVQRADLNPIEEAIAYQRLVNEFGQSQSEVAVAVGKDRVSITNSLRLLKLCPEVQTLIAEKKLSAGHGRALLMLDSVSKQRALADKIVNLGWSVREAERQAAAKSSNDKSPRVIQSKRAKGGESYQVMEIEDRIRRALGTKVSLQLKASGEGEIAIKFFSKSELERLLERIQA